MQKELNLTPLQAIESIEALEPIPTLCEPILRDTEMILQTVRVIAKAQDLYYQATTKEEQIRAVKMTKWANRATLHIINNGVNELYTMQDFRELKAL